MTRTRRYSVSGTSSRSGTSTPRDAARSRGCGERSVRPCHATRIRATGPAGDRELDAKECALWEAINDLEHKLGNPPYYPALYPERELEALDAAIHAWQRRSRWRLHPRWHLWHWEITIHPLNRLKRWLWTRCAGCGKRFAYGESPVTGAWNGPGPRWFRGEPHLYHDACYSRAHPPRLVTVVVENFGPPAGGAPP